MIKATKTDGIKLFDRVALAVAGVVIGYLSGLALGWTLLFFLGPRAGLVGPSPAAGKLFFYHIPVAVTLISVFGFVFFPKKIGNVIGKIWSVMVTLTRD